MEIKLLANVNGDPLTEIYLKLRLSGGDTVYLDACRADGTHIGVIAWISDDEVRVNDVRTLKRLGLTHVSDGTSSAKED